MPFSFHDIVLRTMNMIFRGGVEKQQTDQKFPRHTIYGLAGERIVDVEDFSQSYGIARMLHPEQDDKGKDDSSNDTGKGDGADKRQSAEAIFVAIGGDRTHVICIATPDRRFHPRGKKNGATTLAGGDNYEEEGLKAGEFMMYHPSGQQVHLSAAGMTVSSPSDMPVTTRVMKAKAGTAEAPTLDVLRWKTSMQDDVMHSHAMGADGVTITVQDSAEARAAGGAAIRHHFIDSSGNVKSSMTMHAGGVDYKSDGQFTHEAANGHTITTKALMLDTSAGQTKQAGKLYVTLEDKNEEVNKQLITVAGPLPKGFGKPG